MKQKFLSIFIIIFSFYANAQNDLYVPIEFQKAFEKGTRSTDGKPGTKYWQNHSDYRIEAQFNTATRTLTGKENITYHNESPNFIGYFFLRLYQDMNKPESEKDWIYNKESFSSGVTINAIRIDGNEIDIARQTSRSGTNLRITYPINSGEIHDLYIEWSIQLPEARLPRMGRYDSTTYMIAYWYPQMAVYDDIDGYDAVDYTGQVEFYNDFSNYDVTISIDNTNCIVWATGELQNPGEIFAEKYLSIFRTKEENKILNFIGKGNIGEKILLNKDKIIWHYKAEKVPDFAFSFSDHYYWDFTDLRVDSIRTVRINSTYNPESKGFEKVCQIARDAIKYFSTEMPGIPFPYPAMSVFNGSGGMEFPMMVNDSKTDSYSSDVYLTSHEILHTYFPFFMGINERKYAWMDEGWAVYLPHEFQTKNSENVDSRERYTESYLDFSGTLFDVPLMVQSFQLKSPSYRIAAYQKSACAYDILNDILGTELFKKCLYEYINRWNGKHPTPFDFFNTFKDVSGQNLDWFFKPWFFEFGYPDLAIGDVKSENGNYKIEVVKKGNYPIPVFITIRTENNENIEIYESAKIWSTGVNKVTLERQVGKKIKSIELGNKYIPDTDSRNNTHKINQ